ncbi:MAG: TonB-dependent receptor [Flavobacterium sp.]|nr:TonB-dependent receptor [Flavobacterium sp.]
MSKKITLNSGYQFDEIGVTNSDEINTPLFSRNIKEVSITHTGIAELKFQTLDSRTFLNFGGRLNYFEKFNSVFIEPRLQFHQAISNTLSIELLAEAKSQTLSQIIDLQQDFLGIEKRRWTLANDGTIPIQRSNQWSVGLTYKDNKWLVTWDNFYKKVNGVTSSSQGFQNQFEFSRSSGSYEVIGTELLLQRSFKKLQTWLSYSFNDNKYLFRDLSTTNFPNNFELTHVLSTAIVYDWKQFKVAIGGKWHSGKPVTNTASNNINIDNPSNPQIVYDLPNNSNLPDYFQLNFSALRDWKISSRVSIQGGFSILNLLNKSNIIQKYYRINSTQDGIETVNTYSLKRTPNLNVKLSF